MAILLAGELVCQLQLCQPKYLYTESSMGGVALEAIGMLNNGKSIQVCCSLKDLVYC